MMMICANKNHNSTIHRDNDYWPVWANAGADEGTEGVVPGLVMLAACTDIMGACTSAGGCPAARAAANAQFSLSLVIELTG